jgi:hypothetical protein
MPTFHEVNQQYKTAVSRREVLKHVIEYFDGNFRAHGMVTPPKMLVTEEDRLPVSQESIEDFILRMTQELNEVEQILLQIRQIQIEPVSGLAQPTTFGVAQEQMP